MRDEIVQQLLDLNRQFYSDFAASFSATRQRLQPGVLQVLNDLPTEANLLDLGCGNGELWQRLSQRGHQGAYVGLDFSPALLDIARQTAGAALLKTNNSRAPIFVLADMALPAWPQSLPESPAAFDIVLAFAALHHLPGTALRQQVITNARERLSPGGHLIHSEWQFLNSPRLRQRIQSWEDIGLSEKDVEPGDYLLDWRREGKGLRYVHYFEESELAGLARDCGFQIQKTFLSDGEDGKTGLYQIWKVNHRTNTEAI